MFFRSFLLMSKWLLGETARREGHLLQLSSCRAVPPLPKISKFRSAGDVIMSLPGERLGGNGRFPLQKLFQF